MAANTYRIGCGRCSSGSEDDANDDDNEDDDDDDDDDSDGGGSCSSRSTAEADNRPSAEATAAAAATEFDLLDARRLPDLLDPGRLLIVLDGCLASEYVRGCVVETWDSVLSDHLEAIANLVLYQTPEHVVSQTVYDQLTGLSVSLLPKSPPAPEQQEQPSEQRRHPEPSRVDAEMVYSTLRSAARSLLATQMDACCRQNMCRAVGLAMAALRANTRPVFSVENFMVEINEAANFANLYCAGYAKRICGKLKDIYDAVMAGDYHPNGVVVQMTVMEKSIRAALRTLADAQATGAQKTTAQRSLLAELDEICATVRMKNYGCLDAAPVLADERRVAVRRTLFPSPFVHFTMSPWRAPIRMYHQQSVVSVDQLLKSSVRLIESLVSEIFKPCLNGSRQRARRRRRNQRQIHDKQL